MIDQCGVVSDGLSGVSREAFLANKMIYDATVMRLFTIGEDACNLSEAAQSLAPEIEWHQIRGLRNIIAHGYYEIAPERIWKSAVETLPSFRKGMEELLARIP